MGGWVGRTTETMCVARQDHSDSQSRSKQSGRQNSARGILFLILDVCQPGSQEWMLERKTQKNCTTDMACCLRRFFLSISLHNLNYTKKLVLIYYLYLWYIFSFLFIKYFITLNAAFWTQYTSSFQLLSLSHDSQGFQLVACMHPTDVFCVLRILSPAWWKIVTDIGKYALLMPSHDLDGFFGM
jgi:hypothetical protein